MPPAQPTRGRAAPLPCLVGALLACAALPGIALGQKTTNLIQNPGFDNGPGATTVSGVVSVPGWTTLGGATAVQYGAIPTFPGPFTPGPAFREANYLAGGPQSATASAFQAIDVSGLAAIIDAGNATYDLSAWLGGQGTEDDLARVVAVFNDGNANSLLTSTLVGPGSVGRGGVTSLLERTSTGIVPAGTRTILVQIILSRLVAPYNNGYVDSVSLHIGAGLPGGQCDSVDFNNDGVFPDDQDVADFLRVLGGDSCGACNDVDFNNDGVFPDDADVAAFLLVLGGGTC